MIGQDVNHGLTEPNKKGDRCRSPHVNLIPFPNLAPSTLRPLLERVNTQELDRLGVAAAVVHGNAKRHDGLAARGRANLGIAREVAGNGDVVDRHVRVPFSRTFNVRLVYHSTVVPSS